MESLRTSSLFHYPRKLDALKKILAQGFKPNYCEENFPISDTQNLIVGIPMVSFCDIPLTRITNFKKRYKEYAIGLSKEWGLRNGINPVFYVTPNSFVINSLREVDEIRIQHEDILKERMSMKGYPLTINNQDYIALPSKQSDSDFKSTLISFMENVRLFQVRSTLFGFTKAYSGVRNGKEQNNYEENEWRFVLGENKLPEVNIEWKWGIEAYNNWRGDKNKSKPNSIFQPLKFAFEDVNFIIVRNDTQIPNMIKYIQELKEFGGSKIKKDSPQKSILISKIISMERIEKDF